MRNIVHDQEGAKLTGLRLYRWTDHVAKFAVGSDQALFIFNIATTTTKYSPLVIKFDLKSICYVHAFALEVISDTNFFCPNTVEFLAQQVTDYITSCYSFRILNAPYCPNIHDCCLHCLARGRSAKLNFNRPRLVFVADVVVYDDHPDHGPIKDDNQEQRVELKDQDDNYNQERISPYTTVQEPPSYTHFNPATVIVGLSAAPSISRTIIIDLALYANYHNELTNEDKDATECLEANGDNYEEFVGVLNILQSWRAGLHGNNHSRLKPMLKRKTRADMVENLAPKRIKLDSTEQKQKRCYKSQTSSTMYKSLGLHKVKPTVEIINHARESVVGDLTCSICLESLSTKGETVKMVRCNHEFHSHCIFKWLPSKKSCPYCRTSSSAYVYV